MKKVFSKIDKTARFTFVSLALIIISGSFYSFRETDFEISKNLEIFVNLFKEINMLYVDETNPEQLIEASIEGMLESLDPYTTYIPAKDMDEFKFMTTGKYGGVGALIRKAGLYTIISEPYEGFPAQRAGLQAGDTLIYINNVSVRDKSISEVSELLKGSPNTTLTVKVKRIGADSLIVKKFNREQVTISNVPYYGMLDNGVGYIVLSNFMRGAAEEVKTAFIDLKESGATSVILDLRSNPGGLLDEAVDVANIWIKKGQEIVSTKGKLAQLNEVYRTKRNAVDTVMPMVVLVSRGSASASEIVSGSLQDLDRAVIVGQKTFGKGLVQTTRPLSYNTHLKLTTAKYYIPSGRCIQALDYSHRNEDGSVGYIPDSLISEFKTVNGRAVYDGGGITPDIKIETSMPGNITMALYIQNLLFNYATYFVSKNPKIDSPSAFEISNEQYNDFLHYLKDKSFDYKTKSSEELEHLVKTAKREGYYDVVKEEMAVIEEKLKGDKNKDLITFKDEISELLQDEIVSRYYYQKGRIETGLRKDIEITKALDILSSPGTMSSILDGSYSGETVFAQR